MSKCMQIQLNTRMHAHKSLIVAYRCFFSRSANYKLTHLALMDYYFETTHTHTHNSREYTAHMASVWLSNYPNGKHRV